MQRESINQLSPLDQKRINEGSDQLKSDFLALGKENIAQAVAQINDNNLRFYTLFTLMPEIDQLDLYEQLNYRNIVALQVCAQVLESDELATKVSSMATKNRTANQESLKWIVESGAADDGVYNKYDEAIDLCASILVINYNDQSILPTVTKTIFNRHLNELYNHDLVWCFYQSGDPKSLRLLAEYLKSDEPREVELACKLLHVVPDRGYTPEQQYQDYLEWLNDNLPFLYHTGESFQQTSEPSCYRVNQEARYFHIPINTPERTLSKKLDSKKLERFDQVHRLPEDDKRILSQCSLRLYNENQQVWNRWMEYPVDQQLNIAKNSTGGIS